MKRTETPQLLEVDEQAKKPRYELIPFSKFEPDMAEPRVVLSGKRSEFGVMFRIKITQGIF